MKDIEIWTGPGVHETREFTPEEVRSWPIGDTIELDSQKFIVAIDYFCRKALYLAEAFPWMSDTNEQGRTVNTSGVRLGTERPVEMGDEDVD